jgi:predicted RNA-binding protein YlxR (DUF448 family)
LPGRGAYLCRDAACWDLAARKRALEHALKVPVPADILGDLAAAPAATIEPTHRAIGADTDTNEGGAHGQE